MHVDFLIIGQGISGTFIYHELVKAGYRVVVIDEQRNNSASQVASGVINPVTGRRIVKTWLIDEIIPVIRNAYSELSAQLGIHALEEISILDFFTTPQMVASFHQRFTDDPQYISLPADKHHWNNQFNNDFGFGIIKPAFVANLGDIISKYRLLIAGEDNLLESKFDVDRLELKNDGVHYDGVAASKLIFCDGISCATNPWFRLLPFGGNKGEAVIVEIPGLAKDHVFKKGFSLVPWKENLFWLGSNYLWEYENDQPTPGFYRFAENWLRQTLRSPFKIVDHLAAIRPATLERRPFVGFHPIHPQLGIFNGMGTKGCSLAPFFAQQFVQQIKTGSGLYKEADVQRFTRILSR
jgi:glycine/D-amino acid oxidase-like deaminating enzyme